MFVSGKFSIKQVRREVGAQIKKIFNSGIQPTRIGSHQYLRVFPGVLDAVLNAARSAAPGSDILSISGASAYQVL